MKVSLSPPVAIALRTLGEEERRRVTAWFDHLKNWETDEFVRTHARPLPSDRNVFVLRTSSDFRVFFTFHNGGIEILDIASEATLQSFGAAQE